MKLKGKVLNVELKEKNNNVPPCAENTTVEPSAENSTVEPSAIELSVKKEEIEKCFEGFKKALTFKNKKTGKEVHVFRGSAPRDENGEPTEDACEYQERHLKILVEHGIGYVESLNEVKTENVKGQDILEKSNISWQHSPVEDYKSPDVNVINHVWETMVNAIDNEKNIYIHCGAGLGRTGTAITGMDILSGKFDKYDSLDKKLIALMLRADSNKVEEDDQKRTLIAMLVAGEFVKGNSDDAFFLQIATELTENKLASVDIKDDYCEEHKQTLKDMNNFIKTNEIDKFCELVKAMKKVLYKNFPIKSAAVIHGLEYSEFSEYLSKNRELLAEVEANPVPDSM